MRRLIGGFWNSLTGGINTILVLTVFSALLAPYFRPESFWFGALLANFLPVLGLLLVPFFIYSIRSKRRLLILMNVVALTLVLFRIWPAISKTSDNEASTTDLTLYTQNVPRIPEDLPAQKAIYRAVSEQMPHIIGVQESGIYTTVSDPEIGRAQKKLRILMDSLNYLTPAAKRLDPSGRWYNTRQPILTTLKVTGQTELKFSKDDEDIDPLFMTRTLFDWNDQEIAVYNIHLRTYGSAKPWHEERSNWFHLDFWVPFVNQAREAYTYRSWQVDRILEEISKEKLPFLVIGDFNSSPYSWTYRQMDEILTDVFSTSTRGFGHTFHVRMPLVRIDYVFASDDWMPVEAFVGSSSRLISDHLPLIARVRLKEN